MLKAIIVNIGDEILIGQTLNTNAHEMAKMLNDAGVQLIEILTTGDEKEDIIKSLNYAFSQVPLVLTTGGLGPTHDDITKIAISEFFNRPMYFDEALFQRIKEYFGQRKISVREDHRKQCYMPEGTRFIENNEGTAPGMWLSDGDKHLISMPGVPREMNYIMTHGVIPAVVETWDISPLKHHTFHTFGIIESELSDMIADIIDELTDDLKIAFLPALGDVKIRLSQTESSTQNDLDFYSVKEAIEERISNHVYGKNGESKAYVLGELLQQRSLHLASAESCTGGRLAGKIVAIPGASRYFLGGAIAYENSLKSQWLNVRKSTLNDHGAVSEEVVQEMLTGIIRSSGSDLGVAVSGIAGPTGGTPEKPVGTIWVAWGKTNDIRTKKLQLWKDREKNIEYTCSFCLNVLIKFLKNC